MFGKDYISKPPRTRPELGYWTTIWVAYMTNGKDWGWGLQLGSSSPSMQNSTSSTRWLLYMHNIRPQSVTSNADATLEFGSHFDYSCISNTLKCVLFNPSNVIILFQTDSMHSSGHNHWGALPSGPSDHEGRWPRLRAGLGNHPLSQSQMVTLDVKWLWYTHNIGPHLMPITAWLGF